MYRRFVIWCRRVRWHKRVVITLKNGQQVVTWRQGQCLETRQDIQRSLSVGQTQFIKFDVTNKAGRVVQSVCVRAGDVASVEVW